MLFFVMSIAIVVLSSAVYFAEQRIVHTPEEARCGKKDFTSIPTAFWWCLTTLTTVGYGDLSPTTTIGKMIAGVTSLIGILVRNLVQLLVHFHHLIH